MILITKAHMRFQGTALGQEEREICNLPARRGPCGNLHTRWYYSQNFKRCLPFFYGGCQGNANNFRTKSLCRRTCAGEDTGGEIELCIRFTISKKCRMWRRLVVDSAKRYAQCFSLQSISLVCFAQTVIAFSCSPTEQKTSICFRHQAIKSHCKFRRIRHVTTFEFFLETNKNLTHSSIQFGFANFSQSVRFLVSPCVGHSCDACSECTVNRFQEPKCVRRPNCCLSECQTGLLSYGFNTVTCSGLSHPSWCGAYHWWSLLMWHKLQRKSQKKNVV